MGIKVNGGNKWGQININLVNQMAVKAKGASSYWSTRNRSAPLTFTTLRLEINVDLTPIVYECKLKLQGLRAYLKATQLKFRL